MIDGPGWAGMAGAAGAGDAIADIQNQRFKAIALAQQDALVRLKAQEQAEAVQARLENARQAEADRQEARRNFNATRLDKQVNELPTDLPLSAGTVQNFTASGVAPERFSPQGTSAPAPPPDIAAPEDSGAPQPLPGTIANSPAPNQMTFHRIPTAGEQQQQRDEQQRVMQLRDIENDPNAPPQMKMFAHLRRILPKGENPPADLFAGAKAPTAEQDVQRRLTIGTNHQLGIANTPEDEAWAKEFDRNKTLGTDTSAAAAEKRLQEQQTFQQQEAGRLQLGNAVEKPYRDAHAMADELRDVVASAQAGNKFSASQQTLIAALATIRQSGLSRLPPSETAAARGAGSLWDRIQGAIGKQAAGQPIDEDLQKDLTAYADVIDKSAYKKYREGHQVITRRYKLSDETPLPAPGGKGESGGGTVKMKAPNGQVRDVAADEVEHYKRLGATVVQ